ncbi:hypothetical protein A0H81_03835 [Grifola frondosa]|uniref:Uncharacterized protein n=1 Tax=Grifola frondosa TaxID=5627 RepID=A0A1C7MI30_GRIFR|nr:hypothetical protein A0H81_03835 [Grifola frondosa]
MHSQKISTATGNSSVYFKSLMTQVIVCLQPRQDLQGLLALAGGGRHVFHIPLGRRPRFRIANRGERSHLIASFLPQQQTS